MDGEEAYGGACWTVGLDTDDRDDKLLLLWKTDEEAEGGLFGAVVTDG